MYFDTQKASQQTGVNSRTPITWFTKGQTEHYEKVRSFLI